MTIIGMNDIQCDVTFVCVTLRNIVSQSACYAHPCPGNAVYQNLCIMFLSQSCLADDPSFVYSYKTPELRPGHQGALLTVSITHNKYRDVIIIDAPRSHLASIKHRNEQDEVV